MAKNKKGSITIKVLAVLIAIIMWFYVMSEINPEISKEFSAIKVELKNVESVEKSNLYVLEPKSVEINVKVKGRRDDVLQITQEDLRPYVDLRGITEGEVRVPININPPSKLEIEDFQPKEAIFKVESVIARDKPVNLNIIGTVANGYAVGNEELKPSSVYIRGPRSWVNSVDEVVATVDITGLKEGLSVNLPYKVLNDRGLEVVGIEKEPETIEVSIPVYKVKNVKITPETVGNIQEGYQITEIKSIPQIIRVMGSVEAINSLTTIKTNPIDVSAFTRDNLFSVELIIPEGIFLENPDEKPVVSIQVEPVIEKAFEYTIKDATFINMDKNLEIDYPESSGKLTITIRGIESIINDITRRDITPYIDLKDLGEGEHEVEIQALNEEGIEVVDITPEAISIILRELSGETVENQE